MSSGENPHLAFEPVLAGAALEQARAVAVLVHGRDQDAGVMLDVVQRLGLDDVAYVLPVAAQRSWYPGRYFDPIEVNQPHVDWALEAYTAAVARATEAGVPDPSIVLAGFSQGACLIAELIARNPRPFAGVAVLTGTLLGPDGAMTEPAFLHGLPMYFGASRHDEWGAIERAQLTARVFERAGARRKTTVVIADDQALLRAGFRIIVDAEPDLRVVGEASDGWAAIDVVRRRRPDVVLMDIRMPGLDGLRAAETILGDPELSAAVVMLTTFDVQRYVYEALRLGASGFLLKDAPADRLLDAIRVAAAGMPCWRRRSRCGWWSALPPARDPPTRHRRSGWPPFPPRELEVLRLIARGRSNAEIAAELVLGENTHQDPRQPGVRQARAPRPRSGRGGGLRDGACRAGARELVMTGYGT